MRQRLTCHRWPVLLVAMLQKWTGKKIKINSHYFNFEVCAHSFETLPKRLAELGNKEKKLHIWGSNLH